MTLADRIIASRRTLLASLPPTVRTRPDEAEGGCGVVGFASSVPVSGKHIYEPSMQMHNRGNGKGGGIAAASLDPAQVGVDAHTLRDDYILQIALLDPSAENEVQKSHIDPHFDIHHRTRIDPVAEPGDVGLDVRPPDVVRYLVRAREDALTRFARDHHLEDAPARELEDEFVYQNSVKLNQAYYASLGEQRAFVMSHARDLVIFKIVGYAEQVVQYYGLADTRARIWIAHQRYPTKGRVWHPAGSHPFIGLNEALVHNGDFANYHSVSEYLAQHSIAPQFLTDTEVSVLLFDLLTRTYHYPQEHVIEAIAPTTELDLDQLSAERQRTYRALSAQHIHGSPDGPWFFIIARSEPDEQRFKLLGITDTAMLRPQVFALMDGDVSIGLVGSEKQAIDATLSSLHQEDPRFRPVADRYWNARGGSYTDGGAFAFTIDTSTDTLTCADKFGRPIEAPEGEHTITPPRPPASTDLAGRIRDVSDPEAQLAAITASLSTFDLSRMAWTVHEISRAGRDGPDPSAALETLTLLNDRRYDCHRMRRSAVLHLVRKAIDDLLAAVPPLDADSASTHRRIDFATRESLRPPGDHETTLVIDAQGFPPEGDHCDARLAVRAHQLGWRRFIFFRMKGQRFQGCGLGHSTEDVRMDLYGSPGDYIASGADGLAIHVHDNGQDQLAQIMKSGTLVIHGDVGQAFLYGGKGGEIYVLGNAAGRPLINAVGRPRVVINGTALDYLAESFMAGDPHRGGGFVVLNGMRFDDRGHLVELETPYPGANLFSLASGGAIYVRDPHRKLIDEQLNGGVFDDLTDEDWNLILPYLEKNHRHFYIPVETLLTVDGQVRPPSEVYRKVRPGKVAALSKMQVPE